MLKLFRSCLGGHMVEISWVSSFPVIARSHLLRADFLVFWLSGTPPPCFPGCRSPAMDVSVRDRHHSESLGHSVMVS